MTRRILPLLLFLSLVGCDNSSKAPKPAQVRKAPVSVTKAIRSDVPHIVEAVGICDSKETARIVARTSGQLQKSLIHDGEYVKKGQLLFQIEKEPYEIALRQAEANSKSCKAKLDKARTDYARSQKMTHGGFSSASELESVRVTMISAEADVLKAEAAKDKAQLDLSYCDIISPIDGRAGKILVDTGNVIPAQTHLVTVDLFQPMEVNFSVPEKLLPLLRKSEKEKILKVNALGKLGEKVQGDVIFIGNVDSASGTVPLKAIFPNTKKELWPGEYLRLYLQLEVKKNVLSVKNKAVMIGPKGSFVFVVDKDGKAKLRLVKTGLESTEYTIITEGIQEDDTIVLEGHVRLKDDMPVRIVNDQEKEVQ